jgi:hypothetical protein
MLLIIMSKKKEKTFDAVDMMRKIRNKISAETQGMNLEQLQQYINEKTLKEKAILSLFHCLWRSKHFPCRKSAT